MRTDSVWLPECSSECPARAANCSLEASDCVLDSTGYIGSVGLLQVIKRVVLALRDVNPELVYVCDPVLGDDGKLYLPAQMVDLYRCCLAFLLWPAAAFVMLLERVNDMCLARNRCGNRHAVPMRCMLHNIRGALGSSTGFEAPCSHHSSYSSAIT